MSDTTKFMHQSLGFQLAIDVPSNESAFNRVFGPGAMHSFACSKAAYSFWNAAFYDKLLEKLVAHTGVPVPQDGNKTVKEKDEETGEEKEVPVLISVARYVKLLLNDETISKETAQQLAQQAADEVGPLSPGTGRKAKKPTAVHYEAADRKIASDGFDLDQFVANFDGLNPGQSGAAIIDASEELRDAVAYMYMLNAERLANLAKQEALAM